MQQRRPENDWLSAAVGKRAFSGLKMRKQMRELMREYGLGDRADAHRSRLLTGMSERPDLLVGVAPVHMKRLQELAPEVPRIMTQPAIIDPVRGGPELYETAWMQILQAADWLDEQLERG